MLKFLKKGKPELKSYSDLYAVVDRSTFCNKYGRLCSIFSFGGLKNQPSQSEYRYKLEMLADSLSPFFLDKSHDIHIVYEVETSPEYINKKIKRLFEPNINTMKKNGLDLSDLYDARCNLFKNICIDINSYFAIWTSPVNDYKGNHISIYPESNSRVTGGYYDSLLIKHKAVLNSMINAFSNAGFIIDKKGVYQAIKFVRSSFNPDLTPDNYHPHLIVGDGLDVAVEDGVDDIERILPPLLNKTVTPGTVKRNSFNTQTIGTRKITSFDIVRFPNQNLGFDDLIRSFARIKRPVRISMRLSGDGSNKNELTRKDYLKWLDINNEVKDSIVSMKNFSKNGGCVVGLQATVSTWVDLTREDVNENNMDSKLNQNVKDLIYAVNGWGSTEVDDKGYDPLVPYTNSIPGFKYNNTAVISAPPIRDAIKLMPFWKMHNIWNDSIDHVFHTNLGQIMPFKRQSSDQTYNMILVSGKPGCGKSVLLNEFNLSLVCHPGLRGLPFISIVDIKPSSFGALQMIKDALPESQKHLVVMNRLNNNAESCINPNDTHYGARYPTNAQRSFILNFWSLATQNIDKDSQSDEGKDFLSDLIDAVYKKLDDNRDNNDAKQYKPGRDKKVDGWLESIGYKPKQYDTFWNIFDLFHDKGLYKEAAYVQRYAAPTLKDMISMCNNSIMAHGQDKNVINKISNKLKQLYKSFPAFNSYSRMDYSSAKIISLDLQLVADNSGIQNAHKTAIFYMLAGEVVTRNFTFTKENLKEKDIINEKYHIYHRKKLDDIKDTPKVIEYDELHMLKMNGVAQEKQPVFSTLALNSIISDIRVKSRAEKIEFILLSQDPEDFSGGLRKLYTNAIIMGCSREQAGLVCDIFDLDKSLKHTLPSLGKPGPNGSSFMMVNDTKQGKFSNILFNPIPPEQIWGTSTTEIDVEIRTQLYKIMTNKEARKVLAKCFPSGSAEKYAEDMASNENMDLTADSRAISDIIVERLLSGQLMAGAY